MSYGTVCGWPSAAYSILNSSETPLRSGPMTVEELSWMVSIMCIGGFFGNMFFGCITGRFGRKLPLLLIAVPMTVCFIIISLLKNLFNWCFLQISWCLIIFATNPYYIYVARFISGFGASGTFILIPLFVAEIAEDSVRGSLGSLLVLNCNIGILIAFILGNYFTYEIQPIILVFMPILFFTAFSFFPESPQYLMKRGEEEVIVKFPSFSHWTYSY